jgi:hypothetical protein
MSRDAVGLIRSELGTLERLLRELPKERFIERMGLESRLEETRQKLQALSLEPQAKSLPVTFRGAPVHGMRSIDANFASVALKGLIDAVDTVAASLASEELKARGKLPGASGRSLQIVDTAVGSFGFELELPPLPPEDPAQTTLPPGPPSPDNYALAISTTLSLIQEAANADEDAMSDLIAEIHPRAAAKVRAFAKVLADSGALFAAEFEGRRVRLDSHDDVARVMDALKDEDIREQPETMRGRVLGILPESRAVECRLADGRVIRGKVDRSVEDIVEFKRSWENVDAGLAFRVISIRAKERFVLVSASAAPVDEAQ